MTAYRLRQRGPGWRPAYAEALTQPEELLARPQTRILKKGRSGRIVGITPVDGTPLAIKVFVESSVIDMLKRAVLGSGAARVAGNVARMQAAGMGAPALVAVLERGGVRTRRSCVVTEVVDGHRANELWSSAAPAERPRLSESLGDYMRTLHGRGLYPQDTSAPNFLVRRQGDSHDIVLVDLDRVRQYRTLSWKRRRKNLVQLERSLRGHIRNVDRLRFLRRYLGAVQRRELRRVAVDVMDAVRRKDDKSRWKSDRSSVISHQ
jgi:tRNA A-37 threonylcarbamoyl transferase component Bud32